MGDKHIINGVQLGMLISPDIKLRKKIIDDIIDTQCIDYLTKTIYSEKFKCKGVLELTTEYKKKLAKIMKEKTLSQEEFEKRVIE